MFKRTSIRWFVLVLLALALVACNKAAATPAANANAAPGGAGAGPSGSLTGTNKLALGTLKLEGTDNAVTPAQAVQLLPLWQMLQGGSLQSDQETEAVVKQIEGQITPAQATAIDAMALTWPDVQTWMQEQGIEMPTPAAGQGGPRNLSAEERAKTTPLAGQGGPSGFQNLSEEERAKLQLEFQNMTPEQRATRMAEMGVQRPEGAGPRFGPNAGPGGAGRSSFLLGPLVELLTQRAAQ
jgi:hypothetical protein